MTWPSVTQILADALDLEGDARLAYLDQACAEDAALRAEVESLLSVDQPTAGDEFLLVSAPEQISLRRPIDQGGSREPLSLPERVGRYRIVKLLGEGGMGAVYLAEQDEPVRRRVALKVIRVIHQPGLRQRFAKECQALARLNHPNIAAMYEVGVGEVGEVEEERGLPYVAMEWIDGQPITEWCDLAKISMDARLRLFLGACAGVKHAHEKSILHCDLKPSNVLVTRVDGLDVAKVIDFGVARVLDEPLLAGDQRGERSVIGSLPYISPEALALDGSRNLDTRTDVYSLGLLLYELLCGELPFESEGQTLWSLLQELKEAVRQAPSALFSQLEAPRAAAIAARRRITASGLASRLRGDLDAIILKAIDRDPGRRYGSPAELAADVERHLNHRPVEARVSSPTYRLRRFARRHVGPVLAAVLVITSLSVGLALRTLEARRANRALAESEQVRQFMVDLFKAADPDRAVGGAMTVRELLDQGAERLREELADQPLTRARFLQSIGAIYTELGEYQPAAELVTEALDIRQRNLPEVHPEVIESQSELGLVLRRLGQFDEAEPLLNKVLAARQADPKTEPELLAQAHSHLGNLYWRQERFDEAEAAHRAALTIREQDPTGRGDAAESANNLGVLLQSRGRNAEASAFLRRAAELFQQHLGENHPRVGAALNNLGLAQQGLKSWAAAEGLFREAIAIWEFTHGPDHFRVLIGRQNLVSELNLRHRWPAALAEADRIVEVAEGLDNAIGLGRVLRHQGQTQGSAGHIEDAVATLRRGVTVVEEAVGSDHPETLSTHTALARALGRTGQINEALEILAAVALIQDRSLAPGHGSRLRTEEVLGEVLRHGESFDAAEVHLRRALEGRIRFGENPIKVAAASHALGQNLAVQGRMDAAAQFLESARESYQRILGDGHPSLAETAHELGLLEQRRGHVERARQLLEKAVAIRRTIYPAGDEALRSSVEALDSISF